MKKKVLSNFHGKKKQNKTKQTNKKTLKLYDFKIC